IGAKLRNVSRAQRSTSEAKWCAADTDLGFTRDWRLNVSKSGKPDLRGSSRSVAVPDQRRTAPLRFALHRIRDTGTMTYKYRHDRFVHVFRAAGSLYGP